MDVVSTGQALRADSFAKSCFSGSDGASLSMAYGPGYGFCVPLQKKTGTPIGAPVFAVYANGFAYFIAAWAAARRAIGTRKGEQLT